MKSKQFLQLIIGCFFLLCESLALAKAPDAQEAKLWAEDKGNLLLQTFQEKDLAKKYQKLDTLFLEYVDLDYIAKFVIGKYWRAMDVLQQEEYQQLFKRYALAVYKGFPLSFQYPISFEIINAIQNKNNTDVFAFIDLGKNFVKEGQEQKIMVVFKIIKKQDVLKIIDIKLAESSLILSYRNKFYQMVGEAEEDMTWFLEDFALIIQSAEKKNEQNLLKNQQEKAL